MLDALSNYILSLKSPLLCRGCEVCEFYFRAEILLGKQLH